MSESGFSDQAGHGSEVVEHVCKEDQGGHSGEAIDGKTFEAPGFEGGIAAFDCIATTMVAGIPGRTANGDISGQTDRPIGKTFSQADDATMGMRCILVRAVQRWIGDLREVHPGFGVFQASLLANPFAALTFAVIAIGDQAVAIGTDRSTAVVIAPQDPLVFLFIRLMTAQGDHSPGFQVVINSM